jgi:hypothetical protein
MEADKTPETPVLKMPELSKTDAEAVRELMGHLQPGDALSTLDRKVVIADLAKDLALDIVSHRRKAALSIDGFESEAFDHAERFFAEGVRRGIYEADQPAAE